MKKMQQKVRELYSKRGYYASVQTLLLGAMEELGELAQAILLTECDDFVLKPDSKKLTAEWADARDPAREVGDCITYLLAICNVLGIKPYFKWEDKRETNLHDIWAHHDST